MKFLNLTLALLLGLARLSSALQPPPADGGGRLPFSGAALRLGNQRVAPHLLARLRARLEARLRGDKSVVLFQSPHGGLPPEGSPRILVLLVDFEDYPARPGDTPDLMHAKIFGAGGKFPYESMSAYYRRSSFGKLNLDGDVLGWYRAGRRADVPHTWEGREAVIKGALEHYKDRDFTRYDSDGDGAIDYIAVIWTGPLGKWATFWWGAATKFSDKEFKAGGKTLGAYSWQGVLSNGDGPEDEFDPATLIHETGHALGLPDYYDYKPGVGPDGGVGGFDMMDGGKYDHNCFSKMLLGWTEPRLAFVGGDYTLQPAAQAGDCVMLVAAGRTKDIFGEFFLLENRRPVANDFSRVMSGGLTIWHVDARRNAAGTDFVNNNQDTGHKLLKILESGGTEGLERGESKVFMPNEFYLEGRALRSDTVPSSRLYDGTDTGIDLVSRGGDAEVSFTVSFK
ncbi:MAG: M6 family metalloprotease domain-containing protein [Elusimicrobiales bacterium]|nr:M6 family metalloprotease domain-containing protein [Elusimicrobiales bacterium]